MAAKNHIDLVIKTLAVMEFLATAERGKALKEISAELNLVKSSAFRILFTLKESGYVEQTEANGVYRLTLKANALARRSSEKMRMTDIARPHLTALRDEIDESVALAERRSSSVVLVDVYETSHPLRLSFQIGDECPVHATALGKAVGAFVSAEELQSLLGGATFPQYTTHTKTKIMQLKSDLVAVRRRGYSTNDEETVAGALLIGAPLFAAAGSVCGAISINTPTARCSTKRRQSLISAVVRTSENISKDLRGIGYSY